jgi:hypothetical protein
MSNSIGRVPLVATSGQVFPAVSDADIRTQSQLRTAIHAVGIEAAKKVIQQIEQG